MSDVISQHKDQLIAASNNNADDISDSELLEDLEKEFEENENNFLTCYREKRMQEISNELKKSRLLIEEGRGKNNVYTEEKDLLNLCTSVKNDPVIIHFTHPNFETSKKMKKSLEILSTSHLEAVFAEIEVSNAPFLVNRLDIQILPLVIIYRDGKEILRLIGFEKFGNTINFSTNTLEAYLIKNNVLSKSPNINLIND